jgi:hypothetical protein
MNNDEHILISLEARHAENILDGKKLVELRRRPDEREQGRDGLDLREASSRVHRGLCCRECDSCADAIDFMAQIRSRLRHYADRVPQIFRGC